VARASRLTGRRVVQGVAGVRLERVRRELGGGEAVDERRRNGGGHDSDSEENGGGERETHGEVVGWEVGERRQGPCSESTRKSSAWVLYSHNRGGPESFGVDSRPTREDPRP
jgi:hypothetical protein